MSQKELAKNLIDQIPDSRLFYVIAYLLPQLPSALSGTIIYWIS